VQIWHHLLWLNLNQTISYRDNQIIFIGNKHLCLRCVDELNNQGPYILGNLDRKNDVEVCSDVRFYKGPSRPLRHYCKFYQQIGRIGLMPAVLAMAHTCKYMCTDTHWHGKKGNENKMLPKRSSKPATFCTSHEENQHINHLLYHHRLENVAA
jgi:hypothetical protein